MKKEQSFRSSIADEIVNYVSFKRALGRDFETGSTVLLYLDRFLLELEPPRADLTAETFAEWSRSMKSLSSNVRLSRMRVARNFCLYRRRTDPACFVPDPGQFPKAGEGIRPYIFSDAEVADLLRHIGCLPASARSPLRPAATRLAIVLLYTTGLRRGELLELKKSDYAASERTLEIRSSKFGKSRILPLPDDVAAEVEDFLGLHERVASPHCDDPFLIWNPYCGGRAYSGTQLRKNLRIVFESAGIKRPDGKLPRIHDFRFSFAVNALARWYRNGDVVQAKLPFLAAYMGHVSILSTYYYLRLAEPLTEMADALFAGSYGALVEGISGGAQ